MLTVHLTNGKEIEIAQGKRASFVYKEVTTAITDGAALVVRDDANEYSGKVIASFRAEEVRGFVVSTEDEDGG